MVTTFAPSSLPAVLRSPATCTASSRVGAITSACGAAAFALGNSSRLSIGTPKPRVLPVPVRACPIRSEPPSAIGSVNSWIAKVCSIPTSLSASTISALMAKSENSGLSGFTGACAASGAGSTRIGAATSSDVASSGFSWLETASVMLGYPLPRTGRINRGHLWRGHRYWPPARQTPARTVRQACIPGRTLFGHGRASPRSLAALVPRRRPGGANGAARRVGFELP